jgi:membrane associated rhomboid family serine protease
MALGTRSYARSYLGGGGLPRGVKSLLIANTAMFLAAFFLGRTFSSVFTSLALVPSMVLHGAVWQLGTYMFLHGSVLAFVFNMLQLWMFGRELEGIWGTTRFVQFYFLCGCGAGVLVMAAVYAFGEPTSGTIGASGAIYGILAASAALWPERDIIFIMFPMKMKYLVLLIAGIDFFLSYGSPGQMALLTGLLFGYFYVKSPSRPRGRGPSPMESLRGQYRAWKIKRAKRKFQVYLRKQNSGRDDIIN